MMRLTMESIQSFHHNFLISVMIRIIPTCRYYEQSYDAETGNGRTHSQSTAPCGCCTQCWGRESLIFLKFQKYLCIYIKSSVFFRIFNVWQTWSRRCRCRGCTSCRSTWPAWAAPPSWGPKARESSTSSPSPSPSPGKLKNIESSPSPSKSPGSRACSTDCEFSRRRTLVFVGQAPPARNLWRSQGHDEHSM